MRVSLITLSAVIGLVSITTNAFVLNSPKNFAHVGRQEQCTSSSSHLTPIYMSATMEEKDVVIKTAPDAGYVPEWDNRGDGLSPSDFLQSDMSKPDLSGMWECPLTRWDSDGYVFMKQKRSCRSRYVDRIYLVVIFSNLVSFKL
jgi:hypothetical protein